MKKRKSKKIEKQTKKSSPKASVKRSSKKQPTTMEELLKQTKHQLHGWKRGDVINGIVVEKTKGILYIDIGGKSEGMVIDREMKAARDFIKELEVGSQVEAVVSQPENDKGQTLLSLKKAAADYLWGRFEEKMKTGGAVRVTGREVNKGGLVVEAKGLQGFIPASQFGSKWEEKIERLINRQIEVKPIEVDRGKNRLIFSEREVSEAALLKAQEEELRKIKIGNTFSGKITGVMPFGFFVKIKPDKIELEGLVHISEISWQRVEDPGEFYKVGDKIKVKVLAVDKTTGKLNLSIKQLKLDPWEAIEKTYPVDARVKSKVVRLAPFGAFVDVEEGIEGLIHISKIPAEKSLKVGDKVDCYIESIDKEGRRMSLGLVLKEKPIGYK
ncbi:MAG TPA: S1 RNA-binding domain-containing protein [Patescibacteria group bacterium]|nr:S1 RNA-binding domain-containing protein [Patescibacteria group bacterium]